MVSRKIRCMNDYYTPKEYAERINDLFTPILNYWQFKGFEKDMFNTSALESLKKYAKENHEKLLTFIKCLPVENNRDLLVLIYEKVYYEMINLSIDEQFDCSYLVINFKEIINNL